MYLLVLLQSAARNKQPVLMIIYCMYLLFYYLRKAGVRFPQLDLCEVDASLTQIVGARLEGVRLREN